MPNENIDNKQQGAGDITQSITGQGGVDTNADAGNKPELQKNEQGEKQSAENKTLVELQEQVNQLTQALNTIATQSQQNQRTAQQQQVSQRVIGDPHVEYQKAKDDLDNQLDTGLIKMSAYVEQLDNAKYRLQTALREKQQMTWQQEREQAWAWLSQQPGIDLKEFEDPAVQTVVEQLLTPQIINKGPYAEMTAYMQALNIVRNQKAGKMQDTQNLKGALNQAREQDIRNAQTLNSAGASVPAGGSADTKSLTPEQILAAKKLGRDPVKVAKYAQ